MDIKIQSLILIGLILISFSITKINSDPKKVSSVKDRVAETKIINPSQNLSFQRASLLNTEASTIKNSPIRNWQYLDPKISAEAVLVQALDDNTPFFYLNTYKEWPLASLSKLMTAVIVIEEIGMNKKIEITQNALATEGSAGNLILGEIYTAQDLMKIMLLSSSNDAATAFEDYLGKAQFVDLMNKKIQEIHLTNTHLEDASGIASLNVSTANDVLKMIQYILENHPEIFNFTRIQSFLVQPINDTRSQIINNINPLINYPDFLGGKTGTSFEAKENLVVIMSIKDYRVVVIILGSQNRFNELDTLTEWVKKAYNL